MLPSRSRAEIAQIDAMQLAGRGLSTSERNGSMETPRLTERIQAAQAELARETQRHQEGLRIQSLVSSVELVRAGFAFQTKEEFAQLCLTVYRFLLDDVRSTTE
jgi:hypothetical protein